MYIYLRNQTSINTYIWADKPKVGTAVSIYIWIYVEVTNSVYMHMYIYIYMHIYIYIPRGSGDRGGTHKVELSFVVAHMRIVLLTSEGRGFQVIVRCTAEHAPAGSAASGTLGAMCWLQMLGPSVAPFGIPGSERNKISILSWLLGSCARKVSTRSNPTKPCTRRARSSMLPVIWLVHTCDIHFRVCGTAYLHVRHDACVL